MYLVFELVMRYCDYRTFVNCSLLDKRCSYICNKLAKELKKVDDNYYYETFWNGKKQGLCYYRDPYPPLLEICDYEDDQLIARLVCRWNETYIKYNKKKYEVSVDKESKKVYFSIPGYHRTFYPIKFDLHMF